MIPYTIAMADASTYLTDQLLIAMPALDDPNFARAVAYVCQHDADGAMALVINRRAAFNLGDILTELKLDPATPDVAALPVLLGGPVSTERGFVLHSPDARTWDSSIQPAADLMVTTSRDVLAAIAQGQAPARCLFVLGYAGWGAGQLERELRDNAWLTVPAERSLLFDTPPDRRWQAATASIGIDPLHLSSYAGRA